MDNSAIAAFSALSAFDEAVDKLDSRSVLGLAIKLFKKRRASKAVLKVDIEGFQPRLADGLKDTFKVTDKMLLTLFGRHAIFGSMSKGRKQLMNSSHMTFPKSRISLDALLDSDPIEDEKPVYTDDDIERVMVARDVSSLKQLYLRESRACNGTP